MNCLSGEPKPNVKKWSKWFLLLWTVTGGALLGQEVYAVIKWYRHEWDTPTISEMFVTWLGAKRGSVVTEILAAILCIHWFMVEGEINRRAKAKG